MIGPFFFDFLNIKFDFYRIVSQVQICTKQFDYSFHKASFLFKIVKNGKNVNKTYKFGHFLPMSPISGKNAFV